MSIRLNSNFTDRALVRFSVSDPFVVLTTYDAIHGRSSRFFFGMQQFNGFISRNDIDEHFFDEDCGNTLHVMHTEDPNILRFRINWLSAASDNNLTGYRQDFLLSVSDIERVTVHHAYEVKLLVTTNRRSEHSHVVFTASAHRLISFLSPVERRALSKALSRCWYYGKDTHIAVFADYDQDFCWNDTDGCCGGLCCSVSTVIGSDGNEYPRIRYSIHT